MQDERFSAITKKPKGFSVQRGFYVTLTLMPFTCFFIFLDNKTLEYKHMTGKSEQSNHSNNP